jgi:hypothetical protein
MHFFFLMAMSHKILVAQKKRNETQKTWLSFCMLYTYRVRKNKMFGLATRNTHRLEHRLLLAYLEQETETKVQLVQLV